MQSQHPWQEHPTELISCALEHLHRGTDRDQRIAFLLLDVGVETILKTYLLLPEEVIGKSEPKYNTREGVADSGSFYRVLQMTWETAQDQVQGVELPHVLYYHKIRNKLYHQGDGVVVAAQNAEAYAQLAVDLLWRLLGVDLTDELTRPQRELEKRQEEAERMQQVREAQKRISRAIQAVNSVTRLALEKIDPTCLMPSWEQALSALNAVNPEYEEAWQALTLSQSADVEQEQREQEQIPTLGFSFDVADEERLYRVCRALDLSHVGDLSSADLIATHSRQGDFEPWVDYDEEDPFATFLELCEKTLLDVEATRKAIEEGLSTLEP